MKEFKCRASSVGLLMTEPKLKADKEAGNLGETAKSCVDMVWLLNNFGYDEDIMTEEIKKGLLCEQDSMALVQKVLGGQFRVKCDEHFENEYLIGHPDIDLSKEDVVEDIKTSFTIKTFFNAELTKLYEYQLRAYMALMNRSKARLIYCLVDTPAEIIVELKKRMYFKYDCQEDNPDYIAVSRQIELNHTTSLIPLDILPLEKRIKVFELTRDIEIENKIYGQVEKARIYYNSLTI